MRILIVDDHPILRAGVRQLILARWPRAEVPEAGSLAQAGERVAEGVPAAIVLDLALPDAQGMEGLVRLRRLAPASPILILSMHAEVAYADRALRMGAAGYLAKDRAGDELVAALERLLAGGRYITASLAERLADLVAGRVPDAPPHEALSVQEHRVMLLLAAGRSVGEAAETMHLSVKTVSTYRGRILEKMGLRSNADLTRYCLSNGLLRD
ncbi:MAG: response regulator transcription factor [Thiobacillaceae bacterium]|jgi:DNA-binding NarL/FixJ family response regulator|nr:response regulator transcription factor [Thiobacillaceae bacterium]